METIQNLKTTVASWYKNVPHLPSEARTWIARNIWWIVMIGVILGAFGVLSIVSLTFFAGALLAGLGGVVGAAVGGFAIVAVLVSLAFSIVCLVIAALAISPLKAMKQRGWDMLFLLAVIQVVSLALSLVLTFDIFGTLWGLVWAAVGGYFLFEIRGHFDPLLAKKEKSQAKPVEAKTKTV